ncbi:TIGR02444 family protein [Brevundimonas sp.]|uniref:TIGR02444 family protein n=1 Tax=Brevundimonas sp. TaxID=1871086 RepID=UPI0035AE938D
MKLWEWSTRAWASPGVEGACLDLQDAQGQNIPLLLWAGWTAATGRTLAEDDIEAACDTARVWQETAVAPLRGVRRALKTRIPDIEDADREAIRAQIQAVEIDAERRLLGALEALSPPPSGPAKPALPVLAAVSRRWSTVTPRTALTLLAERLPA